MTSLSTEWPYVIGKADPDSKTISPGGEDKTAPKPLQADI